MEVIREIEIGKIWGMIKRKNGIKIEYWYPVLIENDTAAVMMKKKQRFWHRILLKFTALVISVKRGMYHSQRQN